MVESRVNKLNHRGHKRYTEAEAKMRTTNRLFASVLVTALTVAALAQQPARTNVPSLERLRAHVEYLASDKLEGRRTGSPGSNLAAEYIAREFARYGLRRSIGRDLPGMSRLEADSPRRYLQQFPYIAGVELGKGNLMTASFLDSAAWRLGEDWLPLGFSSNGRVDAPPVFAGYGITAPDLKYDDYANATVRGSIALVFAGTPDGDNPHGQFARFEDVKWKAIAARNAGAKALVVIARASSLKDDPLARTRHDHSSSDAGLPVVVISRDLAARILGLESADVLGRAERTMATWVLGGGPAKNCATPCGVTRNVHFPINSILYLTTDVVRREVQAANVIGILDGSDPTLKNETIVIGAHYDHLGHGGEGSLATKEGEIHHGADDNASGVAGVLELARIFSAQRPRRTIVFIAFSGEEEGLLGSNYYVNHPIMPLANTVAMINMDMIGRMKDNKLVVGGVGTAEEWRKWLIIANSKLDRNTIAPPQEGSAIDVSTNIVMPLPQRFDLTMNEDGFGPSDHSSFYAKQVPVLFFWTGNHEDYHRPSDTADKINYSDEAEILGVVTRILGTVDAQDQRPAYAVAKSQSTGRSTGFRVYLGTIPNYADSSDGLLLDGVRDDSPAAKAGIKAGDKIVKLAGRDVRNVYDYTSALGEMKAGQEYEVELMRGAERIKLVITPAARK